MIAYATLAEAAAFAGMAEADFKAMAPSFGVVPVKWAEAVLYRWADIEESIDRAWRAQTVSPGVGYTLLAKVSHGTAGTQARLPKPKPRNRSRGYRREG